LLVDKTASLTTAINGAQPGGSPVDNSPKTGGKDGSSFSDLLSGKISDKPSLASQAIAKPSTPSTTEGLRFSQHALERMANRGIAFKPEDITRLNDAVDRAAKKGSKESLVLMGDNAFIISVKNKTVVTAMDREAMKENVFTNIDSTVII
jgi:flagellar operon protein